jgi:hypothetical protein
MCCVLSLFSLSLFSLFSLSLSLSLSFLSSFVVSPALLLCQQYSHCAYAFSFQKKKIVQFFPDFPPKYDKEARGRGEREERRERERERERREKKEREKPEEKERMTHKDTTTS